ncbi:sensor histidine kinase [Massilia oculi]|uniref:histidine kinase n=1 Tax=Massilia oculi TaxID=945844 RepID=A0A2S2DNV2_9BURK|nr:sensor histidine kinase [Massilia oculi]AWL06991.1 two-component sensor histidine kinase [Massilia oculi]
MRARRYSIRRRLIRRTMVCMLLILGGISLVAHLFAGHESEEFFSARLASSARVLESLVAHQLDTATIAAPIEIPIPGQVGHHGGASAYGHPYEHKIAFQVWSAEGRLLARSASAPVTPFAPLAAGFSSKRVDGDLWQAFALRSGGVWVLVAEKDEVREEMVEQLAASVLGPVVVGGLLLALVVNLVLSANLAPLRGLADAIARREPESLAPVELSDLPEELAPVVDELNSLLARVRAAFEREQQFIDAAAHEIRTPIAAVQLHVQNALRAADAAERDGSLDEAVRALRRTTQLAEQLLTFSRLASGTDLALRRRVSLAEVCREVIALEEPLLDRRGQSLGLDAPCDCAVAGDPYRLQQLLRNLIDNASQHGMAQGDVDVSIACGDGVALLRVANDGAPVPDHECENVFRPYYRLRPGGGQGAGLGLSIVREIAGQHGATVALARKADGQGCVVTVAFPAWVAE